MATLKDIQSTAKPSYDDWLRGVADSYANNQWEQLGFSGPAGGAGSKATEDLYNKLKNNAGMAKLYDQGITADQITTAPLGQGGTFDSGGFGTFGGKDYGDLTDAQKKLVDSGAFERTYNPTLGESGGYYWQATPSAPGVLGSKGPSGGTAQYTQFNPFNSSQWHDASSFSFDPNYGLVTSATNRQTNKLDDIIYNAAPALAITALTAGAGLPALYAGAMRALPNIASAAGSGNWLGAALSALPTGGALAGMPSWLTQLISPAVAAARGQQLNPVNTGLTLAQIAARYGGGG